MRNRPTDRRSRTPKLLIVGAALTALIAAPLTASAASLSGGSFSIKAQNKAEPKIRAVQGTWTATGGTGSTTPVAPVPTPTATPTAEPTTPVGTTNELRLTVNNQMPGCVAPQFNFTADPAGATIDWGDGTAIAPLNVTPHSYAKPGEYKLTVKGKVKSFGKVPQSAANCIRSVDYFGENLGVTATNYMFQDADNMYKVVEPPKTVTSFVGMFKDAAFGGDISSWDTSRITSMERMFEGSTFNGDLSRWNTSSVTDMSYMFSNAVSFNSPIGGWDVTKVAKVDHMFAGASTFNQDISAWKLSSATNFDGLFSGASTFNRDLPWDTSRVTSMNSVLAGASNFNGNISGWNTSKVTDLYRALYKAYSFNGNLSGWDVSSARDMTEMFSYTNSFNNGSLANWKPSKVLYFDRMFELSVFNQNISGWPVDSAVSWGAFADRIIDRTMIPYKFRF